MGTPPRDEFPKEHKRFGQSPDAPDVMLVLSANNSGTWRPAYVAMSKSTLVMIVSFDHVIELCTCGHPLLFQSIHDRIRSDHQIDQIQARQCDRIRSNLIDRIYGMDT